jgi:protein SCO1/2
LRRTLVLAFALAAATCAARYETRGLVLGVDKATQTVTVSHEAIEGFMTPMVMPFVVMNPSDLDGVEPGDRIGFRITTTKERTRIDRVRILSAGLPTVSQGGPSANLPGVIRPGVRVPDFTLMSHRGVPLSLASLRGRVVAVAFVYTRCPLPDYCPRLMTNFRAVRARFEPRMDRDLVLLTITFDPQGDAAALCAYARRYGADGPGWHFLTGTKADIASVCALFGVEFWPEEGLITHTLRTAVIDREGRLAATLEGKDYSGAQLGDLIERILLR